MPIVTISIYISQPFLWESRLAAACHELWSYTSWLSGCIWMTENLHRHLWECSCVGEPDCEPRGLTWGEKGLTEAELKEGGKKRKSGHPHTGQERRQRRNIPVPVVMRCPLLAFFLATGIPNSANMTATLSSAKCA